MGVWKMWRCRFRNERGGGMMPVMAGALISSLFIAFLFFDLSAVFINKRVTQTGADAAALAAAQTSSASMKEVLRERTQEELESLGDRWEDYVDAADESLSPAEIFADFIQMIASEKGKPVPSDIRQWLKNPSVEVDANEAMRFFFGESGVRDIACQAVRDHFDEAGEAAEKYAKENQNDKVTDIRFIPDEFRIYVETERKGTYTTVPDDEVPSVTSEASVKIGAPTGFVITCD